MFKPGDVLRLTNVSEQDIIHKRYIGEECIFQRYYESGETVPENITLIEVRFPDWSLYILAEKDVELVKPATLDTLIYSYCMEDEKDFIKDLKTFIRRD
mgnify:CR=1 FL=1